MNRQDFERYIEKGGRLFVVTDGTELNIDEGEIVELKFDDDSNCPAFYYPNQEQRDEDTTSKWRYINLKRLKPYIQSQPIENPPVFAVPSVSPAVTLLYL